MFVQEVVGVNGILLDSSTIRVEVFISTVLRICPDSVNTIGELPFIEYLQQLQHAMSALSIFLAFSRYRDCNGMLIFYTNDSVLCSRSRGR